VSRRGGRRRGVVEAGRGLTAPLALSAPGGGRHLGAGGRLAFTRYRGRARSSRSGLAVLLAMPPCEAGWETICSLGGLGPADVAVDLVIGDRRRKGAANFASDRRGPFARPSAQWCRRMRGVLPGVMVCMVGAAPAVVGGGGGDGLGHGAGRRPGRRRHSAIRIFECISFSSSDDETREPRLRGLTSTAGKSLQRFLAPFASPPRLVKWSRRSMPVGPKRDRRHADPAALLICSRTLACSASSSGITVWRLWEGPPIRGVSVIEVWSSPANSTSPAPWPSLPKLG